MRLRSTPVLLATFASLAVGAAPARAAPCRFSLENGVVGTDTPFPLALPLSEDDKACLARVGQGLKDLNGLASVTVAARFSDELRVGGKALAVARGYAELLVAAGLPAPRVTPVAPKPAPGETSNLRIAYTQSLSTRPVALVTAAQGPVSAGPTEASAKPVTQGKTTLVAGELLAVGPAGRATVSLAEGSTLIASAGSLVKLGEVSLDAQLQRKVKLDVLRGHAEVAAAHAAGGSFEVATRGGVAGVRGTRFRIAAEGDGTTTKLETTDGAVGLTGTTGAEARVAAGNGTRVKEGEAPQPVRALPPAPSVESPLGGIVPPTTPIKWGKVASAAKYVVETAEDAEFLFAVESVETNANELTADQALKQGVKRFFRVFAVDQDGFVSSGSKAYAVQLQ